MKSARFDWWLTVVSVIITLFGLLMVYDSSVSLGLRDFGNQYYYFLEQLKWVGIGLVTFTAFSFIDFHLWQRTALVLLLGTILLLCMVFFPGIGITAMGAKRWISTGFFVLQPAELAKLTLTIYLSAWLMGSKKHKFGPFLMLLGIVLGLIILEPDLGTSVIVTLIAFLLYFFSGAPVWHFLVLLPTSGLGVLLLSLVSPYRFRRLMTFFNPESDPLGASYHIRQAIIALGSGGLFGLGVGQSRQKYEYLPEANTDSIFAIIGEEFGFIGATILILLFLLLLWRGFRVARRIEDPFGRLLALGISSWVGIQVVVNIAAMVALIPLTGVPLPLVSYGGSSLIILLAGLGILVNISKHVRYE